MSGIIKKILPMPISLRLSPTISCINGGVSYTFVRVLTLSTTETWLQDHSKGKKNKKRRGQDAPSSSASTTVTSTPPTETETVKGEKKKNDKGDDQRKGRQDHSKGKKNKRRRDQDAPSPSTSKPVTSTPLTDAEKEKEKGDDEGKGRGGGGSAAETKKIKKIVWIRAKVHCTAAGLPDVDAPSKVKDGDQDGHEDDDERDVATAQLPRWHPLSKVLCPWKDFLGG